MPKQPVQPTPESTAIMSSANTQVPMLPHQTATTDTTARYLHVNNAGTTAEDNDESEHKHEHEHVLLRIARFPFHVIGTVLAWLLYPVIKLAIKAHFTSDLVTEHRADLQTLTHRVGQTVGLAQNINEALTGLNREVLDVAKKSLDHERDVTMHVGNHVKGIETQVVKIAEELVRLHESNNKLVVMEREAFEVAQLLAKESVQFPARLRKQLGDAGLPVIDMGHEELMLYVLTMLDAPAPSTTALHDEASNFYDEPAAAKGLEAAAIAKLEVALASERADDDAEELENGRFQQPDPQSSVVAAPKPQLVSQPVQHISISVTVAPTDASAALEESNESDPIIADDEPSVVIDTVDPAEIE